MTTRRLRFALWQHRRSLRRQSLARERIAGHLIVLAAVGRPEPAQRLVGIALRFRVKAICLNAQADAVHWRTGLFVKGDPCTQGAWT
jgi:hypothetical protein